MKLDEFLSLQVHTRKSPTHPEHDLQVACLQWFNYQYPRLRGLLFAVPNGAMLNGTLLQRQRAGKRLKDEGMVAGVADLLLLVPNQHYHGLCIEMKTAKGRQSPSQKDWQRRVEGRGYHYIVVRGLDDFVDAIEEYVKFAI
ncbi:MAG: VRR-NUC domain-containing protein [Coprobacillus sp.]|nr:VRR-NUC domain-containing protein [Coprobacillus sp.]